jgi:hypothetical protein
MARGMKRGSDDADRPPAFRTGLSAESKAAAYPMIKGFRIAARPSDVPPAKPTLWRGAGNF